MKLTRTNSQSRLTVISKINQVISDNKQLFKQGNIFTSKTLESIMTPIVSKLAEEWPPHIKAMHKLTAYTKLNKVLAFRGLRIKSQNYGEHYLVETIDQVKKEVTNYTKVARSKTKISRILDEGIQRSNGKWRKLGKNQINYLLTRI